MKLSARIASLMDRWSISLVDMKIADIGCGRGYWLDYFREWGAAENCLFALDYDPSRISSIQDGNICISNVCALPFSASAFDGLSQFTLFSSLRESSDRRLAAGEMLRVLKPGGFILWHDFFVPNPLNRKTRPVSKREIYSLFPGCDIYLEKVTLLAPLARILCRFFIRIFSWFDGIPFLRTHYLAFIRKSTGPVSA